MENRIELLSRRLNRLERSNRLLKVLSAVAVATLVGFAQLPSLSAKREGPKTFSAQQFVLVDSAGNALATLGAGPTGGGVLTFYRGGKRIVGVGAGDHNIAYGLKLYDGNGTARGAFAYDIHDQYVGGSVSGPEGFASYDSTGTIRTFSGVDAESPVNVGFYVFDGSGAARTGIQNNEFFNYNGLFVNDPGGANRLYAFAALDGSFSNLGINDATGGSGAQAFSYLTSDGSFSGSFVRDANNLDRVLSSLTDT